MITRITGKLERVLDEEVRVSAPPFEYQVLVPEFIRRAVQLKVGKDISFHTYHYFDGDPSRGKVTPRLVGFLAEAEMDFFELFCTVDGVGTRKALKALARPVKEISDAIGRSDSKWLATLPGIGAATAEKIVAALKRKVTRFAVVPSRTAVTEAGEEIVVEAPAAAAMEGDVLEEAYLALMALGNSPAEARVRIDKILATGKTFKTAEEVIREAFAK